MCVWNVKGQFFLNKVVLQLSLITWLSYEFKPWANCLASLGLLSYSATFSVTFQHPCMLHTCASFGDLPAVSHSRDPVASPYRMHTSELFFTLSHTLPLHDSHLNTGFVNAELQENLSRNKANKMVDWIQPYNLPLWLFHDKTLKQTLDLTCELWTIEQNSLTPNSRICVALEP